MMFGSSVRRGLALFLVACLEAALAGYAGAQHVAGTVIGAVSDETGAMLPGVTVEITGPALIGGPRVATTNEEGAYRFAQVPPGTYTLKISLQGFQKVERVDLRVSVGGTVEENVVLKVGALEETLTVSAESPLVDPAKTSVTTNFTQELVRNTPKLRNATYDLLRAAPGISVNQATGYERVSAFGSSDNENMFQMDGGDLDLLRRDAVAFPQPRHRRGDRAHWSGRASGYGDVQGAVFNVVTKSGGNRLSGRAAWFGQYDALTGDNTDNEPFPFHREVYRDGSLEAGGPIRKDRLWYFGNFRYKRDASSSVGVDPALFSDSFDHSVFGKVTWQMNKSQRLAGSLLEEFFSFPSTVTPSFPRVAAQTEDGHNPAPNIQYMNVLNDRTSFEARYAGVWIIDDYVPLTGDLNTPGRYDQVTGFYSQGVLEANFLRSWQAVLSAKMTHHFDFAKKTNSLSYGLQFRESEDWDESVYPGGVQFYDADGQPDYIVKRNPDRRSGRHNRVLDSSSMTDGTCGSRQAECRRALRSQPGLHPADAATECRSERSRRSAGDRTNVIDWFGISRA